MNRSRNGHSLSGIVLESEEKPLRFECWDSAKGDCEGKMRLGPFKGMFCTKHLNQRAEELGVYPASDNPSVVHGEDDWSRRHPERKRGA